MGETLVKKRRISQEEINNIIKHDNKIFKEIMKDMNKIDKLLRNLLPKLQKVHSFDNQQVTKLSKFIDSYGVFCSDIAEDFKNKTDPEVW